MKFKTSKNQIFTDYVNKNVGTILVWNNIRTNISMEEKTTCSRELKKGTIVVAELKNFTKILIWIEEKEYLFLWNIEGKFSQF